ncbi:cysteine hydrolase [Gottschalkiaceae bacterium SANA]|nr:cysteine hydrolase [Gottschalkiaceae bacterium SANA]
MKVENLSEHFEQEAQEAIKGMIEQLRAKPPMVLEQLQFDRTAVIVMDLVNGFAKEGPLADERVKSLIPGISRLLSEASKRKIEMLAFRDCHSKESKEMKFYPAHCLADEKESELVDEIKGYHFSHVISKNSTNGFHTTEFLNWLKESRVDTFILVGDCTDLCIQHFAITLQTYLNQYNFEGKIVIPMDLVDTFHLGIHHGDLMNIMSLYQMMSNGIELVKEIQYQ